MVLPDGRQDQADGELGDSVGGVRWDVGDFEAEGGSPVEVDVVGAGAL